MGNVQGSSKRPAINSSHKSTSRGRLLANSQTTSIVASGSNNGITSSISQERIQLVSIQANLPNLPPEWLIQIEDCVRIWEERLCVQLASKQLHTLPLWLQMSTHIDLVAEIDLSGNRLREFPLELAKFQRLERLALGNNDLTMIPDEIGELRNLQWFDFTHNRISQVSDRIGDLPNLVSLGASDCRLGRFPLAFCRLKRLRKLGCFNNLFMELPPEIGQLCNLTKLDLSGNNLTRLPPEIGKLTALTWLNVSNNRLEWLPSELGKCQALRELGMANNRLRQLPNLGSLQDLILVTAFNNQLEELGEWVSEINSLQKLDISTNKLRYLPRRILNLPHLHLLNVRGNLLLEVPPPHTSNFLCRPPTVNILDLRDNQLVSVPSGILGPTNILASGNPWQVEPLPLAINPEVPSLIALCTSSLLTSSVLPGARMALLRASTPLLRHRLTHYYQKLDDNLSSPPFFNKRKNMAVHICQTCRRAFVHQSVRYLDAVMTSDEQLMPCIIVLCSILCRRYYETHRSLARIKIHRTSHLPNSRERGTIS